MPMKIEKNQNLTGNRLVGGASTVAILVLILNMQACGGGEAREGGGEWGCVCV